MKLFHRKTEEEKRIARARREGRRVKRTRFAAEYRTEPDPRLVAEIDSIESDPDEE